jgi:hypothetical protein
MLYPNLWAYQIVVKTATLFSPFQLVHRLEVVLSIECEIPSRKIIVEVLHDSSELEQHLVHLEHLDEKCHDATIMNEAHKKHVKSQYDKFVHPRIFSEGDLVLVYDQDKPTLGEGNFNLLWHGPYIVRHAL